MAQFGSNDGAFCYQLHSLPHRDFRPTLQLASSFMIVHTNGPWDEPCTGMGLWGWHPLYRDPHDLPSPFTLFENGGYAVIRPQPAAGLLRLPTYRFRPVHADPLHFDLHRGESAEYLEVMPGNGSWTLLDFQVLPATTPSSSTMLSQCRARSLWATG